MKTAATAQLDALGIPYRFFQHAGAVDSLEQAAAERGQRPSQVVRSILFRLGDCEVPDAGKSSPAPGADDRAGLDDSSPVSGPAHVRASLDESPSAAEPAPTRPYNGRQDCFLMVLVAGPGQISWPALRRLTGQRRLTMASPEEVLAVTGCPIGAVSPFGLPAPLPVYIDQSVLAEQEVSLGSGVRGLAVLLRTEDLLRALPEAEILDLRL